MTPPDDTVPDTSDRMADLVNDDGSIDARNLLSGGPHNRPPLSERECYRARVVAHRGIAVMTHSNASEYSQDTYLRHVRGQCDHDEAAVGHPPLDRGWEQRPDPETDASATPVLPADVCRRIRARLADGDSQATVCDALDRSHHVVGRHARGECGHDPDAVGHPPLRYGWHAIDEHEQKGGES